MTEKKIVLNSIEGARELVEVASECDFQVDVCLGHHILNAKSLLGILSLDLRRIMCVKYCGDNDHLKQVLIKYAA